MSQEETEPTITGPDVAGKSTEVEPGFPRAGCKGSEVGQRPLKPFWNQRYSLCLKFKHATGVYAAFLN